MGPLPTFGLLCASTAVVLGGLALVIRFDPAALARRHRFELQVRRATARLLDEAERARSS